MRPPRKFVRVLAALVRGETFNRFEAARRVSDHCLPSTVSELAKKGLRIARRDETVPGYAGESAHVKRYWLDPDPDNVARARVVLAAEANAGNEP